MRKIIGDMHTHTYASGHAYSTIYENVMAAKKIGLEVLGNTDHSPSMPNSTTNSYFSNLKTLPRVIEGIEVYNGSEVDAQNDGTLGLNDKYINKLDYCIVGFHPVVYRDEGREANTRNAINFFKHPKIKFISHPDDDHIAFNYSDLVKAAVDYNVALEVNNSSFRKLNERINCLKNIETYLELSEKYNSKIIVDSDAHFHTQIGVLDSAMEFLEKNHFNEDLILNNDRDKLLEFLLNK